MLITRGSVTRSKALSSEICDCYESRTLKPNRSMRIDKVLLSDIVSAKLRAQILG